MTVKRYEFELYHNNGGEMLVCPDGGYVDYEDYAELQRQLTAYEATVTNLTSQVQGLAAESAQLKEIFDSVNSLENEPEYNEVGMGCGLEDRGITDRYEAMRHGWDCAMERIYGEVIPCAEEFGFKSTDAALAEIRNESRAEGINFAAGRLAAAFNHGFIDKPLAEVFDVTRMILTAKEDIANEPAADGLSGEYAETALKEWAEQLRKEQGK